MTTENKNNNNTNTIDSQSLSLQWKELKKFEGDHISKPWLINVNQKNIILISAEYHTQKNRTPFFLQTNLIEDDSYPKATKVLKNCEYPKNQIQNQNQNAELLLISAAPDTYYNSVKKLYYMWDGNHAILLLYNLQSGEWLKLNKVAADVRPVYHPQLIIDHQQTMHVVGGLENNEHCVFNETTQKFDLVFQFPMYIDGHSLICDSDPKSNRLYLIGGFDWCNKGECSSEIWMHDLSSTSKKQWTKSNEIRLMQGLADFGCIHIEQLNICVLFGGENKSGYSDSISILDFNNSSSSHTEVAHIKCPNKSTYHALLAPTKHESKFDDIHLFDTVNNQHFVLNLAELFSVEYVFQMMHNNNNNNSQTETKRTNKSKAKANSNSISDNY